MMHENTSILPLVSSFNGYELVTTKCRKCVHIIYTNDIVTTTNQKDNIMVNDIARNMQAHFVFKNGALFMRHPFFPV